MTKTKAKPKVKAASKKRAVKIKGKGKSTTKAVATPKAKSELKAKVVAQVKQGLDTFNLIKPDRFALRASNTRWPKEIVIGKRHRKDFGDLKSLAASIDDRTTLIQPIAITAENKLIAGERRLRAWPLTKFKDRPIPVTVIAIDSIIAGEWDENAQRKDFSPTEAVSIKREMEKILAAYTKARQRAHGGSAPGRKGSGDGEEHRAGDQAAKLTGKSRRTIEKAEKIVDAAKKDPAKFGKLQADMDRTGKVDGPFKRLQIMQQTLALRDAPPPLPMRGPYHVVVVDFPWPGEKDADQESIDERGRAMRGYPEMSIESGIKLFRSKEFQSILAADLTAYFWTTNHHVFETESLLDAMGFETHSTMGTWRKNKMGRGQVLRGKTEHCVIARRGKAVVNLTTQTTDWSGEGWDVREDSQKPDAFFDMVEELSPAPRYAEIFSRGGRNDKWDCHGDQVGKFAPAVPKEKQAEILAPVNRTQDDLLLDALRAIGKGEKPDVRLLDKRTLAQLENLTSGKDKFKLTNSGEFELKAMEAAADLQRLMRALPDDRAALEKIYAEAIRAFDGAVRDKLFECIDERSRQAAAVLKKLSPNTYGDFWAGDPKLKTMLAAAAAVPGNIPLWGQPGVFSLTIEDTPYLVCVLSGFDTEGCSVEVKAFAMDPDKPFYVKGGRVQHLAFTYVSDRESWKQAAGRTVAEFCAAEIKTDIARSKKLAKAFKKGSASLLSRPEKVFALPVEWDGVSEPKPVNAAVARKAIAATAKQPTLEQRFAAGQNPDQVVGDELHEAPGGKKRPNDAAGPKTARKTLPKRDRELILFAETSGHIVSRTIEAATGDGPHNEMSVGTCKCGFLFRVPRERVDGTKASRDLIKSREREMDDAITAHWQECKTNSEKLTADEPAASPEAEAAPSPEGHSSSPSGGATDDPWEIPDHLRREPKEKSESAAS